MAASLCLDIILCIILLGHVAIAMGAYMKLKNRYLITLHNIAACVGLLVKEQNSNVLTCLFISFIQKGFGGDAVLSQDS